MRFVDEYVRALITLIGEDPDRNGLKETPERVFRSWQEIYAGYKINPAGLLTVFEEPHDEMVVLRDIEFYSTCEHHMQPFIGKAHVGYLPDGRVVGISKLARLVDCFARRLQIQERICQDVTKAIMDYLKPKGAGCIIEAQHLCMMCRGVQKQNAVMCTSSLQGLFRTQDGVRLEFFRLAGK